MRFIQSVKRNSMTSKIKDYIKYRIPCLIWIPTYEPTWLLQDVIAGLTVGLTAIPQGIAYGVVAGLSPEYGLYAAFMPSFLYVVFGSCKNITIGPTAIMALMVQPLVLKYGPDMAILICFLKGCIITLMGVFHLGFLLDFISLPVIMGFTTAAAINIASSQFKSLLGIPGRSEDLVDTLTSIFQNLNKINKWDVILGLSTLFGLVLLKNIPGKKNGTTIEKFGWMVTLSRNALAVIIGTTIAYVFHTYDMSPFRLTGSLGQGLPPFSLPPFSSTFNNQTYNFIQMTKNMGSTLFTIPIISTIEHIAIAKVFVKGEILDGTQEILALGISNVFASFVKSMPVTGSFTRTAVNHSSGVKTTLGGIFTGILVLLALGFLTSAFQFIPKASLAGVIICAMYYMLDFPAYRSFWQAKKLDFFSMMITLLTCVFLGLEIGIGIGIILNLAILLYFSARPSMKITEEQIEGRTIVYIIPEEALAFPAAENFRVNIMKLSRKSFDNIILDCRNLKRIDVTVAKNIKLLAQDLALIGQELIFINSTENVRHVINSLAPELLNKFKDTDVSQTTIIHP